MLERLVWDVWVRKIRYYFVSARRRFERVRKSMQIWFSYIFSTAMDERGMLNANVCKNG